MGLITMTSTFMYVNRQGKFKKIINVTATASFPRSFFIFGVNRFLIDYPWKMRGEIRPKHSSMIPQLHKFISSVHANLNN
jgi:hypothetical protein